MGKIKGSIFLVLFLLLLWPTETKAAEEQAYTWGEEVSLKGLFDSNTLYFETGEWDVKEARVNLWLHVSQLINQEVSYLTVSLDGQPITTVMLSELEQMPVSYEVSLPVERFDMKGSHGVTVETYLRGQDTEACVDDSAISTWLTISSDSKVVLSYEPKIEVVDIASFYQKFLSIEALNRGKSMVAVKAGSSDTALTAMANIVSGFAGSAFGEVERIKSGLVEKEADFKKAEYILYITDYQNLPEFIMSQLSPTQKTAGESSALICTLSYQEKKILLVTGGLKSALEEAGILLSNSLLIPTLKSVEQEVKGDDNHRMEKLGAKEYLPVTTAGTMVKGNFEQSAFFTIEYFSNKKFAESSELSLDYRYSKNLDFEKSLLTVLINGTPIGSTMLTPEGADDSNILLSIPKDVNVNGNFTLETRFMLYPKEENWCQLTVEEIPWGYIAETSMLKCSGTENTEVFFEYYPFPFVKEGGFSDTTVVLPESWEVEDVKAMTSILLMMGKGVKTNGGSLKVYSGNTKAALKNRNIISIGEALKNQMDTSTYQLGKGLGCAGLKVSSNTEKFYAILTVTGGDVKGMGRVLTLLGKQDKLWQMKGDLVYVNGEEFVCTYRKSKREEITKPEVPLVILGEEYIPAIVVGSVILLLTLSLILLLIKYRKGKQNEK